MNTITISDGRMRAAYAAWMRNLTVLAAALGLAGTPLTGATLVDGGAQEASAAKWEPGDAQELFDLVESLGG
jgi:hypothetical protein